MPMSTSNLISLELVDPDDSALQRVVTLCRRRGVAIRYLEFACTDGHRPGQLVMRLECPPGRSRSVRAWLENLVCVARVEDESCSG